MKSWMVVTVMLIVYPMLLLFIQAYAYERMRRWRKK